MGADVMRMTAGLAILVLGLAAPSPGAMAAAPPAPAAAEAPVLAEARAFMASYGAALLAGDRAGVAGRYHRGGTHVVGRGRSAFGPYSEVVATYASDKWQPPEAFTWNDLRYEALGPDAVVVTGTFTWDPKGEKPAVTIAYTALLLREDGVLRIRLEHE
jgi:hypothetical protein